MKKLSFSIVAIGVLAALLIVAVENPQSVPVYLPGWHAETPLFLVFVVGFAFGGILTFLIVLPARIRLMWKLHRLQKERDVHSEANALPSAKAARNPFVRAGMWARGRREP